MLSQAEKTQSVLKKKGQKGKDEFTQMHLAVYPCQVEYIKKVDHKTSFYFQKNFQVIGQIQEPIPNQPKNTKLPLTNIHNIIHFKLYSASNVVYKWSAYRKTDAGEEEYLESCTLNLRQAVNNFITPQNKHRHLNPYSIVELGFIHTEMKLKFSKAGVMLIFYLLVAEDQNLIQQYVQRKLINKEEDPIIQTFLKTQSTINGIGLNSRRNKTPTQSGLSGIIRKGSDSVGQPLSSNHKQNQQPPSTTKKEIIRQGMDSVGQPLPSNHKQNQQPPSTTKETTVMKASTSQNLQNLIFNFDLNGTITQQTNKDGQLCIDSGELQDKQKIDSDMIFKPATKPATNDSPKNDELNINNDAKKDQKGDNRDYGMLKLESDQGRIRQDAIDKKLELLELEAIQEEKPSRQNTVNNSSHLQGNFSPFKQKPTKYIPKRVQSIKEQTDIDPELQPKKTNFKKAIIIFILSILMIILATNMAKRKTRKTSTKKPIKK